MHKLYKRVALAVLALACAALSACSSKLDDREAVISYVNDNIDGLASFCDSVEDTAPYFESITHTNNHAVSDTQAAEIIDGMYAIGRINDSLFYEEVSYDFVGEPLEKGVIDSITMYMDYTPSYGFACYQDDEISIGFYYTESDKPLYCGKEYAFEQTDDGYEYTLPNNSVYYTEKIRDNWFFYQIKQNSD